MPAPFLVALALLTVSLPLVHAEEPPCGELSIRNPGRVGALHYDYSFDRMDCTIPAFGDTASYVFGRDVMVIWFHDEGNLTDLSVVLSGPGVSVTLPVEERASSDGGTYYATPVHALPEGFRGTLTATLLQGEEVVEATSARTFL
jgi:hypothetical protein